MSYTSPDQLLTEPIEKTLEGLDELAAAAHARIDCGEWMDSHLDDLAALSVEIARFRFRLATLKRNNR